MAAQSKRAGADAGAVDALAGPVDARASEAAPTNARRSWLQGMVITSMGRRLSDAVPGAVAGHPKPSRPCRSGERR